MPKTLTQAKEKQTRTRKNKGVPKRARSSYMFFTMEQRKMIKEQNPEAGIGQLTKMLGSKWKEMSDIEKAPYVEKHERDKERAAAENVAYEAKISNVAELAAPTTVVI